MDLRPGSIHTVTAPVQGTVVSVPVAPGDVVDRGAPVAVIESMKMEHVVAAASAGAIRSVAVEPGALVAVGDPLVVVEVSADSGTGKGEEAPVDPDVVRADLAELGRRLTDGRSRASRGGRIAARNRRR